MSIQNLNVTQSCSNLLPSSGLNLFRWILNQELLQPPLFLCSPQLWKEMAQTLKNRIQTNKQTNKQT